MVLCWIVIHRSSSPLGGLGRCANWNDELEGGLELRPAGFSLGVLSPSASGHKVNSSPKAADTVLWWAGWGDIPVIEVFLGWCAVGDSEDTQGWSADYPSTKHGSNSHSVCRFSWCPTRSRDQLALLPYHEWQTCLSSNKFSFNAVGVDSTELNRLYAIGAFSRHAREPP